MRHFVRLASAAGIPPALAGVLAILASGLCTAGSAGAADRVYWANTAGGGASKISFANLDGSGGGDLDTTGAAAPCCPGGVAIDAAAGRVYWGNDGVNVISFAKLDGSGGGDLVTTGATVQSPYGVAIDPGAGRIYWTNNSNKISFARLDGSGGGDLATAGATVSGPQGIAVDPAAGRVYWANNGAGISFANLDGSGGGDLDTSGLILNSPEGVAIDFAAGRIYFGGYGNDQIAFARLDGSGGGTLNTSGATVMGPWGVAVDPVAGRIYWASYNGDKISFARLDGTGGADLATTGATVSVPNSPALLHVPRGAGVPAITGGAAPGSTLACSGDSWATDVLGSLLYRAPRSISYQWTRDGADIPGATGSSVVASAFGEYRCRATAENQAGSTSQTSAALGPPDVTAFDFAPDVIRVAKGPTPAVPVPRGGSFLFTASAPAAVQIAIERRRTRTRFQPRGTLGRNVVAGDNTVAFTGRIGKKALSVGRYRATLTATNAAGASAPRTTTFRVTRAKSR